MGAGFFLGGRLVLDVVVLAQYFFFQRCQIVEDGVEWIGVVDDVLGYSMGLGSKRGQRLFVKGGSSGGGGGTRRRC